MILLITISTIIISIIFIHVMFTIIINIIIIIIPVLIINFLFQVSLYVSERNFIKIHPSTDLNYDNTASSYTRQQWHNATRDGGPVTLWEGHLSFRGVMMSSGKGGGGCGGGGASSTMRTVGSSSLFTIFLIFNLAVTSCHAEADNKTGKQALNVTRKITLRAESIIEKQES